LIRHAAPISLASAVPFPLNWIADPRLPLLQGRGDRRIRQEIANLEILQGAPQIGGSEDNSHFAHPGADRDLSGLEDAFIGQEAEGLRQTQRVDRADPATGHGTELGLGSQRNARNTQVGTDALPGDLPRAGNEHHDEKFLRMPEEDTADDLSRRLPAFSGGLRERIGRMGVLEEAVRDGEPVESPGGGGGEGHESEYTIPPLTFPRSSLIVWETSPLGRKSCWHAEPGMNKEKSLQMYHEMVLIRRMEERGAELYQTGKIGGFMHLYIGQEAVSTGVIWAREARDRVITAYRDHGVAINCGIPANEVMAELLGKASGASKGKGGSMHMACVEKNMWGGHAIVGGHLPIASGLALGDQYAGNDNVTICLFGDGATNIGYFHEALNLAKIWNLRVLWVCENNQYGMGTAVDHASAVSEIQQKAEGYGMAHERVDGMDVLAVHEAAKKAIEIVRSSSTPRMLEIMTYRFRGHSMGDPERYRTSVEVKKWQENDPIGILRAKLLKADVQEAELEEIEKRAEEETQKAVEFAEASPEPGLDELFRDVYVESEG
jgi:pyruvate dehydrogenase E1 component alpha subunit